MIECTTQAMNVMTLPELFQRLDEIGVPPFRVLLHNLLQFPRSFTVKILSDDLKKQTEQKFWDYINTQPQHIKNDIKPKFQTIIDYMYDMEQFQDIDTLRKQFKVKQENLDSIRNETFVDVFPHLKDWYNAIPV